MATTDWIAKLRSIASVESNSLEDVVPKAFLLPVIALFASLAEAIGAFFGVPIAVFDAISQSVDALISGFFGGPARILDAGALESARSLTSGVWAQFGPFTFVIAVAVVLAAAFMIARFTAEEETGNLIPGIPADFPLIGNNEDD